MKKFAIIVAGGSGIRMGGEIPKQFLNLKGRPILFHTIEKFVGISDEILLVLPGSHFSFWDKLCNEFAFKISIKLVEGGNTRSKSVFNGLLAIEGAGIVAIHDAVRPLVSRKLIEDTFAQAVKNGNAIPVVPVKDSLRMREGENSFAVNRDDYISVQTPQCFDYHLIKSAYQISSDKEFSDDAAVIDYSGGKINLIPGEVSNIKITFSEDLLFAETLMDAMDL